MYKARPSNEKLTVLRFLCGSVITSIFSILAANEYLLQTALVYGPYEWSLFSSSKVTASVLPS